MDAVWLPVLWGREPLRGALDVMKYFGTKAFLVEDNEDYALVLESAAMRALDQGVTTPSGVTKREGVHVPSFTEVMRFGVDPARPLRTWEQYEKLLDHAGSSYALVSHAYDNALVVTRQEGGRKRISLSNTFYCDLRPEHTFPRPLVREGDTCVKCVGPSKGTIRLK